MKNLYYITLVYLLIVKQDVKGTMARHKYTHQKDVSEYCKRRVLPSVFLGRHVLDANSHVLHFSRLELPYSCSISVRAESGSNIILVIQLLSEYSLLSSCTENNDQLLVYEIGETFGGYWGPLPDSIMRQEVQNFTQFYTLQATQQTTTIDNSSDYTSYDEDSEEETAKLSHSTNMITGGDYIEMDVPLLNVSGNFILDGVRPERVDDLLEMINDVTPRKGVSYDTSVVPLLQFSMLTQDAINNDITTEKLRFISEYHPGLYTPDSRLLFRTINKKIHNKRKGFSNRRHYFKKRLPTFITDVKTATQRKKSTKQNGSSALYFNQRMQRITKPKEVINQIMNSLNQKNNLSFALRAPNIHIQKFLDFQQNSSLYLMPVSSILQNKSSQTYVIEDSVINFINLTNNVNDTKSIDDFAAAGNFTRSFSLSPIPYNLSAYKTRTMEEKMSIVTEASPSESSQIYQEPPLHTSDIDFIITTTLLDRDNKLSDLRYSKATTYNLENEVHSNYTKIKTKSSTSSELVTGSMVNHESWENVVQVAPVMAVLLNQTSPQELLPEHRRSYKNNTTKQGKSTSPYKLKNRNKRYIQPLQIKNAIPRVLTSTKDPFITEKSNEDFVDVQDISHLVELKDDEVHGRVALRYMRNYVGSTLFNICNYDDPKIRHVYLFNTSRIVISVSNFTLEKMTLVMTPARVLKSKETNCPMAHIECQISGARVCIDAMSACDGVPNCGAYDIYDEDRLLCGMVSNIRHNVYLAACTFMAVLLTLLYIVHYWLKRCVPRVSGAFFVYTDRSENILNLETVMQSPHEDDNGSKMLYGGPIYDEGLEIENEEKSEENFIRKIWKFCLACKVTKKSRVKDLNDDDTSQSSNLNYQPVKRLYSFAELELSKIASKRAIDVCVQTNDSLEEAYINEIKKQEIKTILSSDEDKRLKTEKDKKREDELNILKFLRQCRSESIESVPVNQSFNTIDNGEKNIHFKADEEKELLSTVYETQSASVRKHRRHKVETVGDIRSEKLESLHQKRLRFDEEATTIPSVHTEDDISDGVENNSKTQVVLGTEKLRFSSIDNTQLQASSSGREFMRFWKGTKSKKKKH